MEVATADLSKFAIILPENPSECIKYGAELFGEYVYKITGVKLSIEKAGGKERFISLGNTAEFKKEKANVDEIANDDGFLILGKNGNLYIAGRTDRGVLYGIIDYLERFLNVRFFTGDFEIVPTRNGLPFPEKFVYSPPFMMRTYITGDNYDDRRDDGYITTKADFLVKTKTRDVFTRLDDRHGGALPVYGRNISHNFHFYVPYEVYGKTHPEFYREITVNGKKLNTIDITNGLNDDGSIDESKDESVVKIVVEELKKDVISHPETQVFLLTQEDGDEYYDDEHNRTLQAKYKRSGMLIRFCNAVIRAVNSWAKGELGKTVKLATFAYAYCQDAPVKIENGEILPIDGTVVADDDLIIQLAIFSNGRYSYFDDEQDENVKKTLKEWKAIGKRFWFWAYDADFSNYMSFFDSFGTIKKNVKGFIDYKVEYVCINGAYDSETCWHNNIRAYAYRRLMWDDSLDEDALIDDYVNNYYGPAAASVKKYIELCKNNFNALTKKGKIIKCTTWGSHTYPEYNPKKLVEKCVKILEKGKRCIEKSKICASEKEILTKRLLCVLTTPLNLLYLNFNSYYPNSSESDRIKAKDEFVSCAKTAGIRIARERMNLKEYVDFVESDDYKVRPMCGKH